MQCNKRPAKKKRILKSKAILTDFSCKEKVITS